MLSTFIWNITLTRPLIHSLYTCKTTLETTFTIHDLVFSGNLVYVVAFTTKSMFPMHQVALYGVIDKKNWTSASIKPVLPLTCRMFMAVGAWFLFGGAAPQNHLNMGNSESAEGKCWALGALQSLPSRGEQSQKAKASWAMSGTLRASRTLRPISCTVTPPTPSTHRCTALSVTKYTSTSWAGRRNAGTAKRGKWFSGKPHYN